MDSLFIKTGISIEVAIGIVFGLICSAIPITYGIKTKLYHFAVTGGIVTFAVTFFPYNMILNILCAGLFYFMTKNEYEKRNAARMRKRKIEEERAKEKLEEEGIIDSRENAHTDVWPPVLIQNLNDDINAGDNLEEEDDELSNF